jgi:hypothetical protein
VTGHRRLVRRHVSNVPTRDSGAQQRRPYSITSWARASSEAGTVRPSASVLRLITSSSDRGRNIGSEIRRVNLVKGNLFP